MLLRFFTVVLCFISFYSVSAQTKSNLNGKILGVDGKPLFGANIQIQKTKLNTTSKADGSFYFKEIPAGNYELYISYIGMQSNALQCKLLDGIDLVLETIILQPSDIEELQTVEIIGRRQLSYKSNYSFAGSKIAMATKDIPQSISVVTKELMDDRQIFRLNDIAKATTGVNQYSANNDLTIRGFRASDDARLINGLRSGQYFFTQPITSNLERIEVIKGPASALFGNAQPGGTINMVTKKPLETARKSVNITLGSFNTFRSGFDFTGPLNTEKTLLYRLNIGYENAGSFRDLQGGEVYMIAPSLTFLPSPKTSVNADIVMVNNLTKLDRGQAVFGAQAGITNLQSTPINIALAATNDYYQVKDLSITLSLAHKFSDQFSFNSSYMKFRWSEDLAEHRTSNAYAVDSFGQSINTLAGMQVFLRQQQIITDNITNYFTYKYSTGALKHNTVLGFDYLQQIRPVGGSQLTANAYRNKTNTASANYSALNGSNFSMTNFSGRRSPLPNVGHFDLANPSGYGYRLFSNYIFTNAVLAATKFSGTGAYIQHHIQYKKIQVLLGFRYDHYQDIIRYKTGNDSAVKQKSFIPRIGLTYSATSNLNLYATYAQGYIPQVSATIINPNSGGPFDPLISKLYEIGAKGEFFQRKLNASISIYDLTQNNVLVADPQPGNPDFRRQRGLQRSRGLEIESNGNINKELSISIGYAYNDAQIVEDIAALKGLQKENAPLHNGNIWVKYMLQNGLLKGLGVAAGYNYVGNRFPSQTRSFELPAYALLDAAVYYQFNKFRLALNLNNLTNQKHWVGGYDFLRLFPGTPRNAMINFGYSF